MKKNRLLFLPVVALLLLVMTGCRGDDFTFSDLMIIQTGMTVSEVRDILGEPDDISIIGRAVWVANEDDERLYGRRNITAAFSHDNHTVTIVSETGYYQDFNITANVDLSVLEMRMSEYEVFNILGNPNIIGLSVPESVLDWHTFAQWNSGFYVGSTQLSIYFIDGKLTNVSVTN